MTFDPNPLYYYMLKLYANRDKKDKIVICNEGSSRSSKTFDGIHFLTTYCDHNRAEQKQIFCFRDTLVNCRDFLIKDFQKALGRQGMGIYEESRMVMSPKPTYNLFGQMVNFRGLDQDTEATSSDFLFFNELLECDKSSFDGWKMRNEGIILCDWNPRYTDHWAFNLEKQPNVYFTRTNYKNNKHLKESVIREIEAYSPWIIEDMALPEDQRRPHEENVRNGTADKYRWLVYGCGLRANKQGLVFPNVTWVDEIPADVDEVSYGMDYGKTAQTAIIKAAVKVKYPKSDLYLKKLFYHPTPNSDLIGEVLEQLFYDPYSLKKGQLPPLGKYPKKHIWADNNQPGWTADLRKLEWDIFATVKFPGSREYWISTLNKYNIHIVRDPDFRKEQENFSYRVVDGKQLSETEKAYDHLWSASGYAVVGDLRVEETQEEETQEEETE